MADPEDSRGRRERIHSPLSVSPHSERLCVWTAQLHMAFWVFQFIPAIHYAFDIVTVAKAQCQNRGRPRTVDVERSWNGVSCTVQLETLKPSEPRAGSGLYFTPVTLLLTLDCFSPQHASPAPLRKQHIYS